MIIGDDMENDISCKNCFWFEDSGNSETGFCDEKETFVHNENYCIKWKLRDDEC